MTRRMVFALARLDIIDGKWIRRIMLIFFWAPPWAKTTQAIAMQSGAGTAWRLAAVKVEVWWRWHRGDNNPHRSLRNKPRPWPGFASVENVVDILVFLRWTIVEGRWWCNNEQVNPFSQIIFWKFAIHFRLAFFLWSTSWALCWVKDW